MKVATLLIFFIILYYAPNKINGSHLKVLKKLSHEIYPLAQDCSDTEKTPMSIWPRLFNNLIDNKELPRLEQCLIACVGGKIGILEEGGEYNKNKAVSSLENLDPLFQHDPDAKSASIKCLNEVTEGKSACETAGKIVKCVKIPNIPHARRG